jgi:CRP-like cAMP-binding protein
MSELSALDALAELSPSHLERLRGFLEERAIEADVALFCADEDSQELYWVIEGRVRLVREGREQGVLEAGSMLGALSLSVVGPRLCEARTQGPARVYALRREAYLRMRSDDPEVALVLQEAILRALAQDLREWLAR